MNVSHKIIAAGAVLALAATPAVAAGTPPSQAKAYGKYCQTQSKKHVAGQSGTPFSQCVKAMARADHSATTTAREACKLMSKKHVSGQQQSPYAKCIVGVAQLRKAQPQP